MERFGSMWSASGATLRRSSVWLRGFRLRGACTAGWGRWRCKSHLRAFDEHHVTHHDGRTRGHPGGHERIRCPCTASVGNWSPRCRRRRRRRTDLDGALGRCCTCRTASRLPRQSRGGVELCVRISGSHRFVAAAGGASKCQSMSHAHHFRPRRPLEALTRPVPACHRTSAPLPPPAPRRAQNRSVSTTTIPPGAGVRPVSDPIGWGFLTLRRETREPCFTSQTRVTRPQRNTWFSWLC